MKAIALLLSVLAGLAGCAGPGSANQALAPISRNISPDARVVSWK